MHNLVQDRTFKVTSFHRKIVQKLTRSKSLSCRCLTWMWVGTVWSKIIAVSFTENTKHAIKAHDMSHTFLYTIYDTCHSKHGSPQMRGKLEPRKCGRKREKHPFSEKATQFDSTRSIEVCDNSHLETCPVVLHSVKNRKTAQRVLQLATEHQVDSNTCLIRTPSRFEHKPSSNTSRIQMLMYPKKKLGFLHLQSDLSLNLRSPIRQFITNPGPSVQTKASGPLDVLYRQG